MATNIITYPLYSMPMHLVPKQSMPLSTTSDSVIDNGTQRVQEIMLTKKQKRKLRRGEKYPMLS